jgi:hypothetical protein
VIHYCDYVEDEQHVSSRLAHTSDTWRGVRDQERCEQKGNDSSTRLSDTCRGVCDYVEDEQHVHLQVAQERNT